MIAVENITMRFGPRILFADVTTTFMAGRRYAISGPNDEDVLDEVATRIWHFHDWKIEDFRGTYEEFQLTAQRQAG
jgi:ATPase subunit of ABC transporter with duplicated ATPase domains